MKKCCLKDSCLEGKNDDEEDEKQNIDLVPNVCIEGANGNQNHCIGTSRDLGVIIVIPAVKKYWQMFENVLYLIILQMITKPRLQHT